MLSREHGKQNLCDGTDGHWTKCVSSRRSWHRVQHNGTLPGGTEESGALCGSMGAPRASRLCAAGDGGLPVFLRLAVVECTWSLGEPVPALSAARMSAAMGDWPFCTVGSGGVVRGCGEIVDGEADRNPGKAAVDILSTSDGDGSHGGASPLSLAAVPSPSGSGDGFLLMPRECLPRSGERERERERDTGLETENSTKLVRGYMHDRHFWL